MQAVCTLSTVWRYEVMPATLRPMSLVRCRCRFGCSDQQVHYIAGGTGVSSSVSLCVSHCRCGLRAEPIVRTAWWRVSGW